MRRKVCIYTHAYSIAHVHRVQKLLTATMCVEGGQTATLKGLTVLIAGVCNARIGDGCLNYGGLRIPTIEICGNGFRVDL